MRQRSGRRTMTHPDRGTRFRCARDRAPRHRHSGPCRWAHTGEGWWRGVSSLSPFLQHRAALVNAASFARVLRSVRRVLRGSEIQERDAEEHDGYERRPESAARASSVSDTPEARVRCQPKLSCHGQGRLIVPRCTIQGNSATSSNGQRPCRSHPRTETSSAERLGSLETGGRRGI